MKDSLRRFQVEKISDEGWEEGETFVIAEKPITLFLNNKEAVTLLATPENLKELAVEFMLSEGWLQENKPIQRTEVTPGRQT